MDLKFSEMSVNTSLAQEYLKKNEPVLELYNDYIGTIRKYGPYSYDGKVFTKQIQTFSSKTTTWDESHQNILMNMASKLKQNASLITQLEYYTRNIPIEDTSAQLNLIIQYFQCLCKPGNDAYAAIFYPNDPLILFGREMIIVCRGGIFECVSKATVAICHLLATLLHEAGANVLLKFVVSESSYRREIQSKAHPVRGLDSGTVAVVSDDADVDSAVDKFIAVSIQAPWRLRSILVQESVYQQFKDALSWKCKLNKSGSKSLNSDVLCADALTYNDTTFLIDPVELTQEKLARHVVTVEAYRTTKEMISLVQQYQARYLSLWTNGIAEINEVTHSTQSPVVWVNNVADFRGPTQVSEAVFSYLDYYYTIEKCDKVAKLCELSKSWLKMDLESRRDILYGILDKYILLHPANNLYTDIRNSLSACTQQSFVDVGKDYVCIGMSQPKGILVNSYHMDTFFSAETFELFLKGNALIVFLNVGFIRPLSDIAALEQAGVPVASLVYVKGDFTAWRSSNPTRTRVVWTNSGTIFAN